VEAVNTRGVGQTEPRGAKNDRTIVWSFKTSHEERYMVAQNSGVVMQTAKAELIYDGRGWTVQGNVVRLKQQPYMGLAI
jgi:hypothetical protein